MRFEKDVLPMILGHLAEYKLRVLQISENGIYIHPKYQTKTEIPYILPLTKHPFKNELNILCEIREDFFGSEYSNITPHRYFHHLNSSQAMCINFFYPLIKSRNLELVLDLMGIDDGVDYKSVLFEKESMIETKGRKTSFDFYMKTKAGVSIYFEIKYTERKFGDAKNDEKHRDKFQSIYLPALTEKADLISKKYHDMMVFFRNYQIMRNILVIDKDSLVVFIYLKDNEKLKAKCDEVRTEALNDQIRGNFFDIDWFDLYGHIADGLRKSGVEIGGCMKHFYEKYLSFKSCETT